MHINPYKYYYFSPIRLREFKFGDITQHFMDAYGGGGRGKLISSLRKEGLFVYMYYNYNKSKASKQSLCPASKQA